VIPSFVRLAEARIRSDVRVPRMQTATDLTLSSATVSLPSNFLEAIRLYLNVAYQREITYRPPAVFYTSTEYETSGNPTIYTIEGNSLVFAPAPTGSPTAKLLYWAAWDTLSADADTNWLLTNHYNVYLYATLAEGSAYLEDDEQAAKWGGQYAQVVAQIMRRAKWGSAMVPLFSSSENP
jgi:hypothetical protein